MFGGVSKQITVRLPEALAKFIDDELIETNARTATEVVLRALERERRRRL